MRLGRGISKTQGQRQLGGSFRIFLQGQVLFAENRVLNPRRCRADGQLENFAFPFIDDVHRVLTHRHPGGLLQSVLGQEVILEKLPIPCQFSDGIVVVVSHIDPTGSIDCNPLR